MAKRIQRGERVIGTLDRGIWGQRQVIAVYLGKDDHYHLVARKRVVHRCLKIRRVKGE